MYTETEFEKLIKSVETEFSAHLAEVQKNFELGTDGSLAKAEDGGKKPPEKKDEGKEAKPEGGKPPEGEAKPEGKEGAPAEGAPAKPEGEAKPAEGAPAAAPGAAAAAPIEGSHGYDPEDVEHLKQMYQSMSKEELKLHHDIIAELAKGASAGAAAPAGPAGPTAPMAQPNVQKSELNAHGEQENPPQPTVKGDNLTSDPANGGIEGGQGPHNSPGAKSPASDANGNKGIYKAEHDRRNGGKIEQQAPAGSPGAKSPASKEQGNLSNMEKSEKTELELAKAETAAANAKAENLQKSLDAVSAILTKLVEKKVAPQGKAITELGAIAKSEGAQDEKSLTKSEIDAKLLIKAQDPKLEKSDRDLINNFYLSGGSVNSISHLLK